jgi:membrane-associated phospholipid phosphatase
MLYNTQAMIPTRGSAVRRGMAALVLVGMLAVPLAASGPPGSDDRVPAAPAGQSAGETAHPKNLKEAGKDFLADAGQIWSSPARIGNRAVFPLIALAAATTFLIAGDESIRDRVQSYTEKHSWVGDVGPVITQLGGPGAWVVAGTFFGAGLLFEDGRARDTGYMAVSAMLQCSLVTTFVKAMTGRQRPSFADGEDHWSGPVGIIKLNTGGGQYDAFPSGHTATAFALATVVSLQYRHRPWVPVVAYALAAGVGFSRMTLDKHWASDVLVGAVFGHLVGRLVVRDHARRSRLVPVLACSSRGLAISVFYDLDPAYR